MLFIKFSFWFLLLTLVFLFRLPADSTKVQSQKLKVSLTGSLLSLANWKGETFESVTLLSATNYQSNKAIGAGLHMFTGKSELGYNYIKDSLWNKQADLLNLQYLVKIQRQKVSQSVNALLNTQLLTSFRYEMDINQQKYQRIRTGTFMNPASMELGYGMNILFWQKSALNISIASARLRVDPITNSLTKPFEGVIGRVNKGWLLFDYGISGQLLVVKRFPNELEWNSSGKLFLKGFTKDAIQFDISNTLSYQFWKHLEMKADLKWIYDPMISFRMQYRNELLFGFVYKLDKSDGLKNP